MKKIRIFIWKFSFFGDEIFSVIVQACFRNDFSGRLRDLDLSFSPVWLRWGNAKRRNDGTPRHFYAPEDTITTHSPTE